MQRNESLSALQALALLNNKFMLAMARHFAERIAQEREGLDAQIEPSGAVAMVNARLEDCKANQSRTSHGEAIPKTTKTRDNTRRKNIMHKFS